MVPSRTVPATLESSSLYPDPHPSIKAHLDPFPTLEPPLSFRSWEEGETLLPSDPPTRVQSRAFRAWQTPTWGRRQKGAVGLVENWKGPACPGRGQGRKQQHPVLEDPSQPPQALRGLNVSMTTNSLPLSLWRARGGRGGICHLGIDAQRQSLWAHLALLSVNQRP